MYMLVSKQYFGRAGGKDDFWFWFKGCGSGQEGWYGTAPASLMHRLVESIAKTSESNVDIVQTAVVRTLRAIMTSPKCGVHECTMLLALRSTFHVYLVTKTPACATQRGLVGHASIRIFSHGGVRCHGSRSSAKDCGTVSDTKSKSVDVPAAGGEHSDSRVPRSGRSSRLPPQYHTDSYVLLGSLCKMC
jgi:brefeldin A-inhibited guanine nucleotide-exchange protein